MAEQLREEERILLELLRVSLNQNETLNTVILPPKEKEELWTRVVRTAENHAVLPLLYDTLTEKQLLPNRLQEWVLRSARQTTRANYRLLFLTKYLTELLKEKGIRAITLKGASTAVFYPVPEYRKAGDVDLLIAEDEACEKACRLLRQKGFKLAGEQLAIHHMELVNDEGITVEIHGLLAEPFDNQGTNQYLKRLLPEYEAHTIENTRWGFPIYQPSDGYHAFYLVLHMLQHFLRAGFGIKNLCDWVVFWNRDVKETDKADFIRLMKESKTEGFVEMLTAACVKYLGLRKENVEFLMEKEIPEADVVLFIREVLKAGEFGKSEGNRMVAMRGTGIAAYAREFHHQMHLNYPKAGRVFLLWPMLWILTLVRFQRNNRKIRNISGREIIKEAARRSRLVEGMHLFKS